LAKQDWSEDAKYVEKKYSKLSLNTNHIWYYQVQGMLFCTERMWCEFVVYKFVVYTSVTRGSNQENH